MTKRANSRRPSCVRGRLASLGHRVMSCSSATACRIRKMSTCGARRGGDLTVGRGGGGDGCRRRPWTMDAPLEPCSFALDSPEVSGQSPWFRFEVGTRMEKELAEEAFGAPPPGLSCG